MVNSQRERAAQVSNAVWFSHFDLYVYFFHDCCLNSIGVQLQLYIFAHIYASHHSPCVFHNSPYVSPHVSICCTYDICKSCSTSNFPKFSHRICPHVPRLFFPDHPHPDGMPFRENAEVKVSRERSRAPVPSHRPGRRLRTTGRIFSTKKLGERMGSRHSIGIV